MTKEKTLHELTDFDCPFTIDENGKFGRAEGVYGPNLLDEKLDDSKWEMITGFSGQYHYSGPIMHNSEYVGGYLEEYILSHPGTYCLVAAYWSPEDEEDDSEMDIEGWAICRLLEDEKGHCDGLKIDEHDAAALAE